MTEKYFLGGLKDLFLQRNYKMKRESSWDRTGGNRDFRIIKPGETLILADLDGPAIIKHMWFTGSGRELYWLRKLIFKIYWDNEKNPSVETPFGDFFGAGHGIARHFISLPLNIICSGNLSAFNSYFPMPFNKNARLEITNEGERDVTLYYHIDYAVYEEEFDKKVLRFHAKWRREITKPEQTDINLTGEKNYLILYAEGQGHYVGTIVSLKSRKPGWWGEGDDMIFVDGEKWPPSIHGTGTEDYFLASYGFRQEYSAPFHGVIRTDDTVDWSGRYVIYRFHIEDPIPFRKQIKVTIEHGHANDRNDDWSSIAYWYQTEPHKEFTKIPPVSDRLPLI